MKEDIKDFGFRPLSRGLFFNHFYVEYNKYGMICFRPLSRGLFFNKKMTFYSELLENSFRPLSRGLFFNDNDNGI